MKKKKIRQSNIELLRIFAMALIIIFHLTLHGVTPQLTGENTIVNGLSYFNNLTFYKKLLLGQTFYLFGYIGNGLFIIITGYFLINKKIDLSKPIKKVLSQTLFIAIFIVICSFLYYKLFNKSFNGLQPVYLFNTSWWFVGYYIGVIIVAALFLNKYLKKLNKKNYGIYLLVLFSIISIFWLASIISGLSENLHLFINGIFLYSCGGYIKRYEPLKKVKTSTLIIILIIILGLVWLSYYNFTIRNINTTILEGKTEYQHIFEDVPNHSFIILSLAIIIFELFKRIKIPNSKIINYIASTTFMIYLIHDNIFFRNIYNKIKWVKIYHDNVWHFLLLIIEWVLIIFALGIIAYIIYSLIMKFFHSKTFKKLALKK